MRIWCEAYPSALAGAATGREYSHEAAIVMQLAAYIRNLGYRAVASMNDTALVIPYAIKAGLGEYGRNQMVLTPEFGPRVRFSKIFTDHAAGGGCAARARAEGLLRRVRYLRAGLSGEGAALGRAGFRGGGQRGLALDLSGGAEMVVQCGGLLRLLGQAEDRLRDLHAGLSVHRARASGAVWHAGCGSKLATRAAFGAWGRRVARACWRRGAASPGVCGPKDWWAGAQRAAECEAKGRGRL